VAASRTALTLQNYSISVNENHGEIHDVRAKNEGNAGNKKMKNTKFARKKNSPRVFDRIRGNIRTRSSNAHLENGQLVYRFENDGYAG